MAKIGDVSKILALKFGLSPSLLALFARVLAEGHVREKDRRGPGAGAMGARDIANFLIAILGSWERPKDAVKAVNQIGLLLPPKDKRWRDVFHFLPAPSLSALPEDHTFADALTALLELLASGEFEFQRQRRSSKKLTSTCTGRTSGSKLQSQGRVQGRKSRSQSLRTTMRACQSARRRRLPTIIDGRGSLRKTPMSICASGRRSATRP